MDENNGNGNQMIQVPAQAELIAGIEQDVDGVLRMMAGLDRLLREVLRAGVDYGVIPGTDKPTLLKPGAEKIIGMLNCQADSTVVEKVEDYSEGFFAYTIRVDVKHRGTGQIVGSGLGACNSREKRYRKMDPFSIQNTVMKMGEKRAKVSAALGVGMASEKFTQDLEDLAFGPAKVEAATAKQAALILKLVQSHVFTDDERAKAWAFCEGDNAKKTAAAFVDKIQGVVKERKDAEKLDKALDDMDAPSAGPQAPVESDTPVNNEANGDESFLEGIPVPQTGPIGSEVLASIKLEASQKIGMDEMRLRSIMFSAWDKIKKPADLTVARDLENCPAEALVEICGKINQQSARG